MPPDGYTHGIQFEGEWVQVLLDHFDRQSRKRTLKLLLADGQEKVVVFDFVLTGTIPIGLLKAYRSMADLPSDDD